MVNRIEKKFEQLANKNEKGLITYITAGDPNLATTKDLVVAIAQAGADLIELGIPYSDPVADGPVIQQASIRSLANGTTLERIFNTVSLIRLETQVPLILMTYVNPILQYGIERFMIKAMEVGIDGLIIPDLPLEEMDIIRPAVLEHGLCLIPLVAPTSTPERIQQADKLGQGFIYCVSLTGVTGVRNTVSNDISEFMGQVKQNSRLPLAIGFGISGPEQASQMAALSDAVIVGSAIVKLVEESSVEERITKVTAFVRQLKAATMGRVRGGLVI